MGDKDLGVYEFSEEDESVEAAAGLALSKFGKQSGDPKVVEEGSPPDTVNFLQALSSRVYQGGSSDVPCVDIDAHDDNCESNNFASDIMNHSEANSAAVGQTFPMQETLLLSGNQHNLHFQEKYEGKLMQKPFTELLTEMRASCPVMLTLGNKQSECNISELVSDVQQNDASSDDYEKRTCSSSCPSPDDEIHEGSLDPLASIDRCTDITDTEDIDTAVIISPDYVVYEDKLYGESLITFLVDCIKIECSDASGGKRSLILELLIEDLLLIDRHWSESVESAWVEVQSRASNVIGTAQVHDTSGITRLAFTVCGPQWLKRERKIMSLASNYKDIWRSELHAIGEDLPFHMEGEKPFFPRKHLSDFEEAFEDVVYPRGDPDAVCISKSDIELLRPETFINDTLIDFYVKYLKNKIGQDEMNRFHFFNSFFFRKLADLDKDPKSSLEGQAAFLRVHKWTRKVNIFEKDYVFIPVNFNLHWSLLVICHPGEIACFGDKDINESVKVPCILHMDSIKGSHSGLKNLIQSYLWEEWKERNPESPEETSYNFSNLRFVPLELPQQENYFDCGLFLLHYVELFLQDAPVNFSPFNITTFSNFLSIDWFVPAEASVKRFVIPNILYELIHDPAQDEPRHSSCSGHRPSGNILNNFEQKSEVEFISSQHITAIDGSDDSARHAVVGTEIKLELLERSSVHDALYDKDDGYVEQQFVEPKATAESPPCQINISFQRFDSFEIPSCTMSTVKEDLEEFVHQEVCEDADQSPTVIRAAEIFSTSYSSRDSEALDTLQNPKCLVQLEESADADSLSETMTCAPTSEKISSLIDINKDTNIPCQNVDELICSLGEQEKTKFVSAETCRHALEKPNAATPSIFLENSSIDNSQEFNSYVPVTSNQKELVQKIIPILPEYMDVSESRNKPNPEEMPKTCINKDSHDNNATSPLEISEQGDVKLESVPAEKCGAVSNILNMQTDKPENPSKPDYEEMPKTCIDEDNNATILLEISNQDDMKPKSVPPEECGAVLDSLDMQTDKVMTETFVSRHSEEIVAAKLLSNDHGDSFSSQEEHPSVLPGKDLEATNDVNPSDDSNVQMTHDASVILTERQPSKRRKIMHSGIERRRTRSFSRTSSL